jgi:hypothetical protein
LLNCACIRATSLRRMDAAQLCRIFDELAKHQGSAELIRTKLVQETITEHELRNMAVITNPR